MPKKSVLPAKYFQEAVRRQQRERSKRFSARLAEVGKKRITVIVPAESEKGLKEYVKTLNNVHSMNLTLTNVIIPKDWEAPFAVISSVMKYVNDQERLVVALREVLTEKFSNEEAIVKEVAHQLIEIACEIEEIGSKIKKGIR